MRVLIQWTTATVQDWVEYDFTNMSQVRALPKKPVPGDSPVIDDQPGWISAINIQGVVMSADHLGFGIDSEGRLVVGKWNDDADDWAAVPFGWLYVFDTLAPDPNLPASPGYIAMHPDKVGQINGEWFKVNTRQTVTRFMDSSIREALIAAGETWAEAWADAQPWAAFPSFNSNVTLHGVWVSNELQSNLEQARSLHGWREWA